MTCYIVSSTFLCRERFALQSISLWVSYIHSRHRWWKYILLRALLPFAQFLRYSNTTITSLSFSKNHKVLSMPFGYLAGAINHIITSISSRPYSRWNMQGKISAKIRFFSSEVISTIIKSANSKSSCIDPFNSSSATFFNCEGHTHFTILYIVCKHA